MPARHKGKCPGCDETLVLTRHHILPRRFFGVGKHNDHICLLCQVCHHELEARIPQQPRLPEWQYFAILAEYLRDKANYREESEKWLNGKKSPSGSGSSHSFR